MAARGGGQQTRRRPAAGQEAPAAPPDFLAELPQTLPAGEPYYYLSGQQADICQRHPGLRAYARHLPGWVPHRQVALALGHGTVGIDNALKRDPAARPYVWGTEFENVHTFWRFREPRLVVDGVTYHGSEDYFHRQKPNPFDARLWNGLRDDVMRRAVQEKFKEPALRALLLSTRPHPLLSIKGDDYWGVHPSGQGENMLARLLEQERDSLWLQAAQPSWEIVDAAAAAAGPGGADAEARDAAALAEEAGCSAEVPEAGRPGRGGRVPPGPGQIAASSPGAAGATGKGSAEAGEAVAPGSACSEDRPDGPS